MTPQADRVEAAGLAATDQLRRLEGAAGPYIRVKCGCCRPGDGTAVLSRAPEIARALRYLCFVPNPDSGIPPVEQPGKNDGWA
jgi:hypothetical protein